eukprot:TRINITY_DN14045_c0_g1_i1.p1 TRINITY_DN14045_c0_g1~~TRINITY_DN14045_c0_g1_i1.p1  ORF type:complete len:289 (-),score=32.65 TRINITY_DN14045_c0_g1_i1:87-953(-)
MYECCCCLAGILRATTGMQFQAGLNDGVLAKGVLSRVKAKVSLVGDAINVAARLCFKAQANSICMSQNVFKHFPAKDATTIEFKAKGKGTITAYSVKIKETKIPIKLDSEQTEIIELETILLYADIVEYTRIADKLGVKRSFELLRKFYLSIDEICIKNGLCKIDLIGDCYSIASACPDCAKQAKSLNNQLERIIKAAKEIQSAVRSLGAFQVRIGVHQGVVHWAKLGAQHYDVFGESVQIVQELQNSCTPGQIIISQAVERLMSKEDLQLQKNTKALSEYKTISYFV